MESKEPIYHMKKGMFLIASPDIESGLFFRSVILLCEHSSAGSFGLIVNKPLNIEMPEEVASLGEMINPNVNVRTGGRLQPGQMMLLHNSPKIPEQTLELAPNLFLGGDLPFLQDAIAEGDGSTNLLLCFGYSGWTAGHLEKEYLDGNWFLYPATSDHVFKTPSDKLWATLLKEMGGRYASLSQIPEDLSLN